MKKLSLLFLFISTIKIAFGQICSGEQVVLSEDGQCNSNPFELEFEDNFDGNTLDLSKWEIHPEQGSLEGGESKQYYSLDNVTIENGICKITAKKETVLRRAISWKPDNEILSDGLPNLRTYDYTSSWIWTKDKFSHGKFEINCKIPKGKSFWPAFWMYGMSNGVNNEIDVFEFWDNSTEDHNMTVHYNGEMCLTDNNGPDYSLAFHTFTVVWDNYKIEWYVDGNLKRKSTRFYTMLGQEVDCNGIQAFGQYIRDNVFPRDEMNIIANLALQTGTFQPDANTPFPSSLEIDYVRIWKQDPLLPPPPPCDANSITVTQPYYFLHLGESSLVAKNTITTSGQVTALSANQTWQAGDYIDLNPGFETVAGINFTAQIGDCDASNMRVVPSDENNQPQPVVLQTTATASKNNPEKELQEEERISNNANENLISPNPSTGIFTLMSHTAVQSIEVRDMLGNIVYQQKINSNAINMDIDLSSQPKGVYILQVKSSDKIYTEKVVVQ